MREGYENGLLKTRKNNVKGMFFGSDFCAEHEVGIKDLKTAFGIGQDEKAIGLDKRRITVVPESFRWHGNGLSYVPVSRWEIKQNIEPSRGRPHFSKEKTLWTAWAARDFAAYANDVKEIKALEIIAEAINNKDAIIMLGGGGFAANPGLCISIISKMGKDVFDEWEKHDLSIIQLEKDVEATGIRERLEAAGKGKYKGYYALSPMRCEDSMIKFWLNPMKQNTYHYGWYTVEELDLWIQEKGPIVELMRNKKAD